MDPTLNRLGGLTILKENDNKQVTHIELARGKSETKESSGVIKFDTSRSIAEQISTQLRETASLQQNESKK